MAAELVPGPSAGRWDLRRRIAQLGWVIVLVAGVAILATRAAPVLAVAIPTAVLVVAAMVTSWVCAARASRVMRLERAAGYSTLLDAPGFALRDARTLEVLRAADEAPTEASRRSLTLGIFGVKPGTVLARLLDDEKQPPAG